MAGTARAIPWRSRRSRATAPDRPRPPWQVKAFARFVVACAVSRIGPIPDFVPVLGFLDGIALLPAGRWAAIRARVRDSLGRRGP